MILVLLIATSSIQDDAASGPRSVVKRLRFNEVKELKNSSPQEVELPENLSLEERVLEYLVGDKKGGYVDNPPPRLWSLMKIGDRAIPIILKHASDDEVTLGSTYKVLNFWAWVRLSLPMPARDWVIGQFKKGPTDLYLIDTIGGLGLEEHLPQLEKLAKGKDDRQACVAVQSIAAIGTEAARKSLEGLLDVCCSKEASTQCKVLLEKLYLPFLGAGGEDRLLKSIELTEEMEPLKFSLFGGWLAVPNLLLRRLVFSRRKDLLPKLEEMANRVAIHEKEVLKYDRASGRLAGLKLSIHLLGGKLDEQALNELRKWGTVERP